MGKVKTKIDDELLEFMDEATRIQKTPLPVRYRFTLYFILLFIIICVGWAYVGEIDRVVVAKGKIITNSKQLSTQVFEKAIIKEIKVRMGDDVKKGDVLAVLDQTFSKADAKNSQVKKDTLNTRYLCLKAEVENTPELIKKIHKSENYTLEIQLYKSRKNNYQAKISKYDAEINQLKNTLKNQKNQIKNLNNKLEINKKIYEKNLELEQQQYIANSKLLEIEERYVSAKTDLTTAENKFYEYQQSINTIEKKKAAFISNFRKEAVEKLANVKIELDTIVQELKKYKKRETLVKVRAPADGVVFDLTKFSKGSVIQAGETLVTLVPKGKMNAEIRIPAADIARVREADEVRIKLEAYPFQKYGTLSAILKTVSNDGLQVDPNNIKPIESAYYKGIVDFKEPIILSEKKIAGSLDLVAGMNITAEIKIGTRKVWTFFLYPVFKMLDESLRETR